MIRQIYNATGRINRITIPAAIAMCFLAIGIASQPVTHCSAPAKRDYTVPLVADYRLLTKEGIVQARASMGAIKIANPPSHYQIARK